MTGKPSNDRRTERTRTAINSAFRDLVLSEGYAALTVERVAASANVGRSTFYMHFKSLDDLLQHSLARPSTVLAQLVSRDVTPESLVPQLEHFHGQRLRNRVVFDPSVREIWIKCLAGLIAKEFAQTRPRAKTSLPPPMVAQHIAQVQIALIVAWLSSWPQIKAMRIAEALIATTRANVDAFYAASAAACGGSS
jgi:AcrR family transcriptional regulator